jgi:hypothetical protein
VRRVSARGIDAGRDPLTELLRGPAELGDPVGAPPKNHVHGLATLWDVVKEVKQAGERGEVPFALTHQKREHSAA